MRITGGGRATGVEPSPRKLSWRVGRHRTAPGKHRIGPKKPADGFPMEACGLYLLGALAGRARLGDFSSLNINDSSTMR
jgi:hypothetical protein